MYNDDMYSLQDLPTILTIFLFVYIGFLVGRNSRQTTNRLFLLFLLADSIWLGGVLVINTTAYGANIHLGRLVFASVILLLVATLMFINKLLDFRMSQAFKRFVYLYGGLVLVMTCVTSWVVKRIDIHPDNFGLNPYPRYGLGFVPFCGYVLMLMISYVVILSKRKKAISGHKGITKQQLQAVTVGIISFAAIGFLTNLVLPTLFSSPWPSRFAPIGSLVMTMAFFYAIGRYRLFDIRTAIARGTTYVFVLAGLALVLVISASIFNSLVTNALENRTTSLTFNTIAALIVGVSFQPLKNLFDKLTSRFFFRDAYDSQEVVGNLNQILIANNDITTTLVSCEALLTESMKLEFCFLGLFEEHGQSRIFGKQNNELTQTEYTTIARELRHRGKQLAAATELTNTDKKLRTIFEKKEISAAALITLQDEQLGFAIFGDRKNGKNLSSQDLQLITTAINQIAIAIKSALRFEEIENFNATLQQRVEGATHKLQRTNEKLRQLDETKDDFISMASHQLRTPLTSVKGYVSMVLDGDGGSLTALQRKLLNQSFISAQRMVYLISDLLNLSRLKTGKFVIERTPTNLAAVVHEEVRQLVETAEARNLQLTFQKPEHFPTLMLDETKTRQVIMNFIDNAIYYTPSGGKITVKLENRTQSVELAVTDTGIGVPREEQHRLFTKFYRADNAKRARPDGTGLGLFMAKKVIAAQGGAVIFKSVEGRGSTFGFTFAKAPLLPLSKDRSS